MLIKARQISKLTNQQHYDFIMELSKKTNKKVAMRLAKEKNIVFEITKNGVNTIDASSSKIQASK